LAKGWGDEEFSREKISGLNEKVGSAFDDEGYLELAHTTHLGMPSKMSHPK
jgi:hypothetical protein